jgi:hypothetical protein
MIPQPAASSRNHGLYFDDDDDDSSFEDTQHPPVLNASTTTTSVPTTTTDRTGTVPTRPCNNFNEDEDDAAIAAQYSSKHSAKDGIETKRRKIERPKITIERMIDPEYGLLRIITNIPRNVGKLQNWNSSMSIPSTTAKDAAVGTAAATSNVRAKKIDQAAQYMNTVLQSYNDIIMNDWLSLPSSNMHGSAQQQQVVMKDVFHKIAALGSKLPLKDHLNSLRHEMGRNPYVQTTLSNEPRATKLLQQYDQYTYQQQEQQQQQEPEQLYRQEEEGTMVPELPQPQHHPPRVRGRYDDTTRTAAPPPPPPPHDPPDEIFASHASLSTPEEDPLDGSTLAQDEPTSSSATAIPSTKRRYILEDSEEDEE